MSTPARLPKPEDLVNVPEFEDVARLTLAPDVHATIAGGDRAAFDRMTFRPRMLVPTLDLDLGVDLFGDRLFTPLIVGPVGEQRRYHAQGELATARGASTARAALVVSSRSSVPIREIAAETKTPLWYSVYADGDARKQIDQGVAAGCKAVFVAVGATGSSGVHPARTAIAWKVVEGVRRGLGVPLVIKGVMTTQEAKTALELGAAGVVVSDHGSAAAGKPAPLEVLASVVEAVAGKAAVLVDGSFRRGSDIAKALILGARGVLVARPVMWGLAAYGETGVRTVIELLQSDLGRTMGAIGASNVGSLTRERIRIHRR